MHPVHHCSPLIMTRHCKPFANTNPHICVVRVQPLTTRVHGDISRTDSLARLVDSWLPIARWGFLLFLIACLWSLASGCSRPAPSTGAPSIVTSFYPIYDLTRQIAGTNVTVICLVPPGGDPHHEDPTPEMARQIQQAKLVLVLGLGMDHWVERMATAGGNAKPIALGEGLAHRRVGVAALANHSGEAEDPGEVDPHIWLDPLIAAKLTQRITAQLESAFPESAGIFRERGTSLARDLHNLHTEFDTQLSALPNRSVVTFHGAYAYLFERYRLKVAGVIELFPGTEPSIAYLKDLVDLIRQLGLKTIFAEPQLPDRPAQVIAREIGGSIERLDPCETVLSEKPEATYQDRQRQNLKTLVRVLGNPTAVERQ